LWYGFCGKLYTICMRAMDRAGVIAGIVKQRI
jgi:hypothetical protein